MLDLAHPSQVCLQDLPACVVVVIVDIHPGLDTEAGVPHPVVVVAPARGGVVRGGHHGPAVLHIEIVAVVLVHPLVELLSKARTLRHQVVVAAVSPGATVRIEALRRVLFSLGCGLPAAALVLAALLVYTKVAAVHPVCDGAVLTEHPGRDQQQHQTPAMSHLTSTFLVMC